MEIATRFVSTGLVVAAFALFPIIEEKGTFEQTFDVFVTYALFFGVLGLDMVTLLLWFYSDWTVAYFKNLDKNSFRSKIINKLLSLKKQRPEEKPKKVSFLSRIINKLPFLSKLKQEQSKKDSHSKKKKLLQEEQQRREKKSRASTERKKSNF